MCYLLDIYIVCCLMPHTVDIYENIMNKMYAVFGVQRTPCHNPDVNNQIFTLDKCTSRTPLPLFSDTYVVCVYLYLMHILHMKTRGRISLQQQEAISENGLYCPSMTVFDI